MNKLSKTDYLLGLQCPLALWFKYHRKDLKPPITPEQQALFDAGYEVNAWAKKYFGTGFEVNAPYWELEQALQQTKEAISNGEKLIFEATAQAPDGTYSRVDILRQHPNGEWDLIEVKGSTEVKDYQLDDIGFQYYVFHNAGYKIKDCYLMVVNNEYVRDGDIDPKQLLRFNLVSDEAFSKYSNVEYMSAQLMYMLEQKRPPQAGIGAICKTPFECGYIPECWKNVPEYSIFNVFDKNKSEELYRQFGADLKKLPEDHYPDNKKVTDILCYLNDQEHIDKTAIKDFLSTLEYPLYFLDYETVNNAVPLFDGTRPFQQIPFQFSLHIQKEPDGELEHIEFLHHKKSDPRPDFAKALVDACGDKGSVVVYNQAFESRVNKELAENQIIYSEAIHNISKRMVDLLVPFRNRHIYHPKQKGSASIKYTLPAFTDMSYADMDVANGSEASNGYLRYVKGQLSADEENALFNGLSKYCEQDTLAMVKLLEVLGKKSD